MLVLVGAETCWQGSGFFACASAAHGPIVHTNALHGTGSPSTSTDVTLRASPSPVFSTPSTAPMRSVAPAATAASISFVHSS